MQAAPLLGPTIDWFHHYARTTQVFFVIGGFVMARTMHHLSWNLPAAGNFLVYRYCRLGLPYLAAIGLAIAACAIGRGLLPPEVTGTPPTLRQFIAHLFFLQDLLGFESFSAGLWFICINFQLGLIYVALLLARDTVAARRGGSMPGWWHDFPVLVGWLLATYSLFHFNLEPEHDQWGLYFFPYFFTGVMVHHGLRDKKASLSFLLYLILLVVGIAFHWRWRLASALVVGALLFAAERANLTTRWPKSRVVGMLGKASYSLFLIHFPVLVLVASLWTACGWSSPPAASAGLLVAAAASIGLALPFHRWVEVPAGRLSRRKGAS
jgi:peptidoglycan/LPS O-acetylase OafA/YrhL